MNIIQAMRNKYEKIYHSTLKDLEFIDNDDTNDRSDSKDLTHKKKDFSREKAKLKQLCIFDFDNNKKLYKKSKMVRHLKMFFGYDLPLISLAASAYFIYSTPKRSEIVPVYNISQTMISDDKVITDIDDTKYFKPSYNTDLEDNGYNKVNNIDTKIQYQVKNGTNNVIVHVDVNGDGELKYDDYLSGNFYDRNSATFKDIEAGVVEEKYQEVINDISEFIQNDSAIPSQVKKDIQKLLEDNKTMVITTIVEYFENGEVEVVEKDSTYIGRLVWEEILWIFCTLAYCGFSALLFDIYETKKLYWNEDTTLEISNKDRFIVPFKTAREEKLALIRAESARRAEIANFVNEHITGDAKTKYLK